MNEVSVLVSMVLDSVDVIEVSVSVDVLLLDCWEREETSVLVVKTFVRVVVVVPGVVPVMVVVVQLVPVTEQDSLLSWWLRFQRPWLLKN